MNRYRRYTTVLQTADYEYATVYFIGHLREAELQNQLFSELGWQ